MDPELAQRLVEAVEGIRFALGFLTAVALVGVVNWLAARWKEDS